ncbi:hypothetical protein [uncultured Stenotrophomonas sp.]|uniref:hypothetical protein n=1 Tax=uncultured Stenotrophomonas sp. TaxID=165438 RepID=UPI00258A7969|nr:hypothetical protein [uncultured Stenotrophomonas sp.]
MIFPIPVPMYLPGYSPTRYDASLPRPSVNMHGVETKLSDIGRTLEKISASAGKQHLTVQVEASAILPLVSIANTVSGYEAERYHRESSALYERLNKVDSWKERRERKKKAAKKQAEKEDQESRKEAARVEFEGQPKPKFWQKDTRKDLEFFERKNGVSFRLFDPDDLSFSRFWPIRHYKRETFVNSRVSKHFSVDYASQIEELFQICRAVPGAVLNVPHDLMRVVAQIAKEKQLEAAA